MIKPIFLIGTPKGSNPKDIEQIQISLERKMSDYHILVYRTNAEEMEFKVFYEKDFNKTKFDELKRMVKDSINKPNC